MSRMNEVSQEQEFQENLSGMADYEEWIASQEAMPEHKRDGYVERMNETEFKTAPRVPVETACPTDSGLEKPF